LTDRDEQSSLKAQVAELYKTQNTHLQTIKSLESGLSSIQDAEQRLKQESPSLLSMLTHRLTALRERRNDLELRAVLHGETLREKNQQIQVLQDELLATGISLNVLEAKAVKLQEENKELLERWLAKVKADADGMNEANQFLEQIRGMRMSSPTSTGEEAPLGVEETARESED
jgi:chromosome segregation ATPase